MMPLQAAQRVRSPARWIILALGLAGAAGCIFAALAVPDTFFYAYLYVYLFWLGISLGCLVVRMLHGLTGGQWGVYFAPFARAAGAPLWLMALLFVPLILAAPHLYPWASVATSDFADLIAHRAAYLNLPFVACRALAYFVIWLFLAWRMNRHPTRALCAAGIVIYFFTMTHAAIDWIMSLEPPFYSTIFGFMVIVGQAVTAFAFLIVSAYLLLGPPDNKIRIDLGNLLLTSVILWAYISFMQLLVIWMGNLREDNVWYVHRGLGIDPDFWRWVGLALVVFHFLTPFFLLLFRFYKIRPGFLLLIALLLLLAHVVEQMWLVLPSRPAGGITALDFAPILAIGGLWLFVFLSALRLPEVRHA